MHSIYEIRRSENRPDEQELNKIEFALSMILFLSKDFEKSRDFAQGLVEKPEVSQSCKDLLKIILDNIERD